jgi:DNA replication protein DnaC
MNSVLNVNHNSDHIDINEAIVLKQIIDEGYTYPLNELSIQYKDFDEFIKLLSKYELTMYDFTDGNQIFKQFKCDEFWMNVSGGVKQVFLSINCKKPEIAEHIFKQYKQFKPPREDASVFMSNYFMKVESVDNSIKEFKFTDFTNTIPLYYPYIDVNSMFEQFFGNKENILILCGKPGTGKTQLTSQLLKYALDNPSSIPYFVEKEPDNEDDIEIINVAYVKNTDILSNDMFWRELAKKEFDFVILDDLDYFLTSREEEVQTQDDASRNKFINQFLSFTDGIEQNRTKFIITTNQPFVDMNIALMRKGRLFDILELRDLSNKEALAIWLDNKLLEEKFPFKNQDRVLQADLGSIIQKSLNSRIVVKPYLNESGVSKITKKTKKVGL